MAKTEGPQEIPSSLHDLYKGALVEQKPNTGIQKRAPYRLPTMQDNTGRPHYAQTAQREKFKAAVARFNALDQASRAFLYNWCSSSPLFYYTYFIRRRLFPMPNFSQAIDIDVNVSHRLYVHLAVEPEQVNLYLFGSKFNAQLYTELGQHKHDVSGAPATENAHTHPVNNHQHGGVTGSHNHGFEANLENPEGGSTDSEGGSDNSDEGGPGDTAAGVAHTHGLGTLDTANKGVAGEALSAALKDYFNGMTIEVDGVDKTAALLTLAGWAAFGDGTSGHAFNGINGTGKLDITSLISWTAGQHYIDFKQAGSAGGRLKYNLYFD